MPSNAAETLKEYCEKNVFFVHKVPAAKFLPRCSCTDDGDGMMGMGQGVKGSRGQAIGSCLKRFFGVGASERLSALGS